MADRYIVFLFKAFPASGIVEVVVGIVEYATERNVLCSLYFGYLIVERIVVDGVFLAVACCQPEGQRACHIYE